MVGIHPRTGKRWRNGRRIAPDGRVLNVPPVIISVPPVPEKRSSPRYLSEDERVRLADLRRERRTMREIAALMGRSLSTISRESAGGADAVGRYGPLEAYRRALERRRLHRLRIPLNPITHSGVFDHPRSEAAERPTRGLVHPLLVTSSRWSADSLARRPGWAEPP